MKRKDIILWYASVGCFGIVLVPFVNFMFHLNVSNLRTLFLCVLVSTVFYIFATKRITHPKGYTAIQAMSFYKICKKEEIAKPEQCRKRTVKFKEIASKLEYTDKLELDELFEMYQLGYDLIHNGKDVK